MVPTTGIVRRHSVLVRVTHWITTLCFFALLVSGMEIVVSHPRFYWGEVGNIFTHALFELPIPSSRSSVPTGYGYVLEDQNGWSRYLHFEAAWFVVATGLLYATYGLLTGHFRKRLIPRPVDFSWRALSTAMANHLRFKLSSDPGDYSYNVLQRLTYLFVIFALFPVAIWTGLAMSPAIVSVFPAMVSILGGQQSARTIHFLVSLLLSLFVLVHITMIAAAGFRMRMRAMITGRAGPHTERA